MTAGPNNLLHIATLRSTTLESALVPGISSAGEPTFDSGEQVLWQGAADVAFLRQKADGRPLVRIWEFPAKATVWVTSARLVYTCRKFDAGEWKHVWMEDTELLVSIVGTTKAMLRRHGRIAIGEVRHEWPIELLMLRQAKRFQRPIAMVGVTCVDPWDDALVRLLLSDSDSAKVAGLARTMLGAICSFRLAQAPSLTGEMRLALDEQNRDPRTREGKHPFSPATSTADPFSVTEIGKPMFFPIGGARKIG